MRFIHYTYPSARSVAPVTGFGGRFSQSGLQDGFDALFGTALSGLAPARGGQIPVDLYEDKENVYVRAELPGVIRDAIIVEIVDGVLTIKASRPDITGNAEKAVSLSRRVAVSDDVQADKVAAAYENGLLTVTLPRKEETKPKKVNVSVN
jgi:HSP20 family protein